jgi:tetratricopeptide (TPR) repeat protein
VARAREGSSWPFRRHVTPSAPPAEASTLLLDSLAAAFPAGQLGGTRLLLTQPTYQLQRWLDWLAGHPSLQVVADMSSADPETVREAGARRGAWARSALVPVLSEVATPEEPTPFDEISAAFRQTDVSHRLRVCRRVVEMAPGDPASLLALASASIEHGDFETAADALEEALRLDPAWEATHFELGKLWLRLDDTERAASAFRAATTHMPSLAVAHSNLGAALAELERPEEALEVLEIAAALDPFGHTVHSNRGAALRDLGRLDEAVAAFRRVIELQPGFVFGHYNLGHALFLQGAFDDARRAYARGLDLDPEKTPRQRARLALACAGAGDTPSAVEHGLAALTAARDDGREDIRAEMLDTLRALAALGDGREREAQELQRAFSPSDG